MGVARDLLLTLGLCYTRRLGGSVAPEYNETEALTYVRYAQVSFCDKRAIENWDCGSFCEAVPAVAGKIRFIPGGLHYKVQGYIAQVATGQCVVGFRGSSEWRNWWADLKWSLEPWPPVGSGRENASWCKDCLAHSGFASAYEEIRPLVLDALAELHCTRLAVAGHSLGGAIAALASFDFRAALELKVDRVWTFGKPRVGNDNFVDSYEASARRQGSAPSLWRVVHYHDPIPRLPPEGFLGWTDSDLEVYYTTENSDNYLVCPQDGHTTNSSPFCSAAYPFYKCVNLDHLHYLNQSFAHGTFPEECISHETPIFT